MFKLPNLSLPNPLSAVEEFADYLEHECFQKKDIQIRQAIKPILLVNDEVKTSGIQDEDDAMNDKIEDVLAEFERRKKASNSKYPFSTSSHGYTMKVVTPNTNYWIYSYLLYSTRVDMSKNKVLNKIDGTQLLEQLSAIVAKEYFGEKSDSMVFGTAGDINTFERKVSDLVSKMGEGDSFVNRDSTVLKAQDDKLDIVVWKNFTDQCRSKLIGFGQCKTGTSWDDQATIELQPRDFCDKWLRDNPIVPPIKMFFSSQYFPLELYSKTKNAGLIFDRFRILDYLPKIIDNVLLDKIKKWTTVAMSLKPTSPPRKRRTKKKPIAKRK
jgi:hypothetical protein